jgi:hypothetical protein
MSERPLNRRLRRLESHPESRRPARMVCACESAAAGAEPALILAPLPCLSIDQWLALYCPADESPTRPRLLPA